MQIHEIDRQPSETEIVVIAKLLDRWVSELEGISLSENRSAVINREQLLASLIEAHRTQQPLVFVAIGCQDWIKPEWIDNQEDRLLGKIRVDDKRVKRFIAEMAQFSASLRSLHIPHRFHLSLSDVEPLMHIKLQNMGLVIQNPEAVEFLDQNVTGLTTQLQSHGVAIEPFSHAHVLADHFQTTSLDELQTMIAGKKNPSNREFLDGLYAVDLTHTCTSFVAPNEVGPVWLDIQSFNFSEEVASLAQIAQDVSPDLPILSVFPNAGNWRAAHHTSPKFSSREQLLAEIVGLQSLPQTPQEWWKKLHKSKDEAISGALLLLGQEPVTITSGQEKSLAVRMFMKAAFDLDPLSSDSKEPS